MWDSVTNNFLAENFLEFYESCTPCRYFFAIATKIAGKVLRSDVESLLTPTRSPTASLRLSNPNVKRAGALLILREQNMRPLRALFCTRGR